MDRWLRKTAFGCLAGALALSALREATAVTPENGWYMPAGEPGSGVMLELDNGVLSVGIYTYEEGTGAPAWYVSGGVLRDDFLEVPEVEPNPLEGFYPIHGIIAPLYRFEGGACLSCDYSGLTAADEVGTLAIYFSNHLPVMSIAWHDESRTSFSTKPLEKLNVSRGIFGRAPAESVVDLSGSWIIYALDPDGPLIRISLELGSYEVLKVDSEGNPLAWRASFVDPARSVVVDCSAGLVRVTTDPDDQGELPIDGCEMRIASEPFIAWINEDDGLARISAFAGTLPRRSENVIRRETSKFVGVRAQ